MLPDGPLSPITTGQSPAALTIPKEGYFELERGRYGPVFPRTPACYGFTIIAKVKPGREEAIREHGRTLASAVDKDPEVLDVLKLHYLKWQLFNIGDDLLPVPRDLRHRLRQVHRGCGEFVQRVGHHDHLRKP